MPAPVKRISEAKDMEQFAKSPARKYIDMAIERMSQLVVGYDVPSPDYVPVSVLAQKTVEQLNEFIAEIEECPPATTKQRFGNPSFRDWLTRVNETVHTGNEELDYYLINAFGSSQRIDYGTGHELSFIAYWDGLLRLNHESVNGEDTLFVFDKYFRLCREIVKTYNLEPAGSHGVWGLDDHFHLPFILGAAQMSQQLPDERPMPKDLLDPKMVEQYKNRNLYFGAIDFILSEKRGPFFEHSPILYDVSGVKSMSKIRSGMIKMYNGEVLSKLQVVQHFYFGELFPFDP